MARVTFTGRKLPLKLRNIAERESGYWGWHWLTVHAMKCGRGCAHGYARWQSDSIRLYLETDEDGGFDTDINKYLFIHELAHIAAMEHGHNAKFYANAIRIARREGCLRGFLNWQGRKAKAYARRAKAA